ncbi:MAG TPA: flagellin [Bacillota bacterium]|nr:flagellin [Bacillota bacterium]
MRINTNISALNASRNLGIVGSSAQKSMEKLSSGYRINRAADDAAGLAISEGMRSQISGLKQASSNAQDAISLVQTAEGALTESHSILKRMRELSVQAANDTNTANDRMEIQKEVDQLKSELDRIAGTSSFNNKNLLDGSASAITSSDKATTSIYMRGGIREGAVSAAGSYTVGITVATSGIGQVQKSTTFQVTDVAGYSGAAANVGKVAAGNTQLKDVSNFYNESGNFLIGDEGETITLMDGTGKTTSFTIFGSDTLTGVALKFNNAMTSDSGLGMSGTGTDNVAVYNTSLTDIKNVSSGQFAISSSIVGNDGEVTVIAGEALLNAFGFNESQAAKDASYDYTITGPDGTTSNGTVVGNQLKGLIHENVDVRFDTNADSAISYNSGVFSTASIDGTYTTTVDLVDNTQTFQIGANELQTMTAAIGRIDSEGLGVKNVIVTNTKNAGEAITKIDAAISRVSSQRSTLGAIQNRLDHTINNLGVANENITSSESRIRDVDMAAQMMEYTKLNVLQQAGISMLAQANQQPQMVLSLLG